MTQDVPRCRGVNCPVTMHMFGQQNASCRFAPLVRAKGHAATSVVREVIDIVDQIPASSIRYPDSPVPLVAFINGCRVRFAVGRVLTRQIATKENRKYGRPIAMMAPRRIPPKREKKEKETSNFEDRGEFMF
ncbi:hypothetical protein KM043_008768 [Ampulex compressa]|nr:hypothetical protein KM043_008768 [Ampulex compressa]